MKILIACLTCPKYLDRRNAVRDTWSSWCEKLNDNVTFYFFTGSTPCLVDDSVGDMIHLFCPDDYDSLPQKTLKLIEYTLANGFDYLIKTDDDTFLLPTPESIALLTSAECVGNVRQHPPHNDFVEYAQGGCYSLSKTAMEAVLTHGLPKTGLEDGNVGKALKAAGIAITNSDCIKTDYRHGIPRMGSNIISAHTCTPQILHDIFDGVHVGLLSEYNDSLNKQKSEEVWSDAVTFPGLAVKQGDSVTICITSCNRHDLLKRTLESLSKCMMDFPIKETIIYEDSEAKKPDWLREYRTLGLGEIRWMSNGKRLGQWMSIDKMYDTVQTELIFHCEDDWEFDGRPFMAASAKILEDYPSILQVSLRGDDNTSGHPNVIDPSYLDFLIQEPYWREHWGGFTGNPGLRRKSDWQKIRSYGALTGYGNGGIAPEQTISKTYLNLGYRIAVLPTDKPFVKHIGERRSRAIDKLTAKPKVLIAVPVCHHYSYGTHDKDIKVSRQTEGRIEALRATWWKDIKPFSDYVTAKFFYGTPTDKKLRPQADEIFLNCPDDYNNLSHKMRAIYQWALNHGYDYVIKADDDTFIYIDRLMRSGFESHDQMGYFGCKCKNPAKCGCYVTGMCYTLSKRAMNVVAAVPPTHWAEECSAGKILRARNIHPTRHQGWLPGFDKHFVDLEALPANHNYIALHAVNPEGMHKLYGK